MTNETVKTPEEIVDDAAAELEKAAEAYNNLNRAQRRALKKKMGKKGEEDLNLISDTAKRLSYVDLIQKLRKLNKEKENENYEDANEDN